MLGGWRRAVAGGVCVARRRWVSRAVALALVAALPPLHIFALAHFWSGYSRRVSRISCSCSCWDTVFKGPYETGVASYKHMYFNATENTLKMWLVTVGSAAALYEATRRLTRLAIDARLRPEMALLFVASLYSHYYSAWAYINYYNDEFYDQWYHQLFFTITEVLSTCMVLHLADKRNVINSMKVAVICCVATLHIVAGGWDQFYTNVVLGNGKAYQVVRDVGFMLPDVLHAVLPPLRLRCATAAPPRARTRTARTSPPPRSPRSCSETDSLNRIYLFC